MATFLGRPRLLDVKSVNRGATLAASPGVIWPPPMSFLPWHELPLPWLRNRLWRVSHDALAGAGCGELGDRALHPIALTIALHRGHLVVIGRLRLETGHAHAENRLCMAPVDTDGRFRRLAQVLGIRPVGHDGEMNVRPPRVVGGPPDNGQVVASHFERWPLGDLDARGFLRRRKYLSGGWVGGEQGADGGCDRQFKKQSLHGQTPRLLFLWKDDARAWGSRATPM